MYEQVWPERNEQNTKTAHHCVKTLGLLHTPPWMYAKRIQFVIGKCT
jgi:hypothetical protein